MAANFPTAATTAIVTIGTPASLNNLTTKTFMFWMNPRGLGGGNLGRPLSKRESGPGWTIFLGVTTKLLYRQNFSTTEGLWQTADGAVTFNVWQHVALSYDLSAVGNNPTLYINGVAFSMPVNVTPVGTATSDSAIAATLGNITAANREFDGFLDDERIYNRILTAAEILTIYNCQGMDGIVDGLAARWPFKEATPGTTISGSGGVKDVSLNKNNGTGTNSPLYNAAYAMDRRRIA